MLRKDTETNIPLMLVIGWNADEKTMVAVYFNTSNGEYLISS